MRYLKRINESLNSKTLTKEEVIELLKKNCQKFLSYANKGDGNLTMDLYSQLDPDDEDYNKSSLESWCEDEVILIKVDVLYTILNELEN